jgi:hypothetical protein
MMDELARRAASTLAALAAIGSFVIATGALAAGPSELDKAQGVVREAMAAAERGAYDDAVDRLELLSDQGFVHRDASLARAYAYVERARSRAAQTGDLGRAAAALEEAERLGAPEAATSAALDKIRSEIARRRTREARAEVSQRPRLGRAVTSLLSENSWAILAAFGSTLLTAGLAARSFMRRRGAELAGAIGIVTGLFLATIGGALAAGARHYRTVSRPAVVVTGEARLLDDDFRPLAQSAKQSNAVPEGTLVYVRAERAGRYRVEWGVLEGWIDAGQLRLLATNSTR